MRWFSWPRGKATACKAVDTGSNPVGNSMLLFTLLASYETRASERDVPPTGFEPMAAAHRVEGGVSKEKYPQRDSNPWLPPMCGVRRLENFGTPNGIRTRATAVKGRRPRPLDDGGQKASSA